MRLANQVAIITGAGYGLGAEIARHYVAEGARVMLCGRDESRLRETADRLGDNASIEQADVSVKADIDRVVARTEAQFGRVDVLVNNAGIYGPMGMTHEIDWDEWVQAIQINLLGTVAFCRAVTPGMIKSGRGKIVNISGGGATNPLPRLTSYAASKAAVVRFSESIALELKPHGIDVNAIAPGALATNMLDQVLAAGPDAVGAAFHARMLQIRDQGGTPLDVGARLAVYLGSAESDGITGRLISAPWDPWEDLQSRRAALDVSDIYTLRRIVPKDRGQDWGDK